MRHSAFWFSAFWVIQTIKKDLEYLILLLDIILKIVKTVTLDLDDSVNTAIRKSWKIELNPFGTRVSFMRRNKTGRFSLRLIYHHIIQHKFSYHFAEFFWPLPSYWCNIFAQSSGQFVKKMQKSGNWFFLKGKLGSLCRMVRVPKVLSIFKL
jgi:hypothetical protein